ncbi:MAG: sigma-70 family RNA polymerase sigma factor [Thermoleophilia bacterium]|nr:sigma-70 family RNA polymerase sigma factor [Thermoleophilia bacterium]
MLAVEADEATLIVRCQAGDRRSFEPIVRRHMRAAASYALAWTGDRQVAIDLSQEAFARAYRSLGRFDPERPFYPWFHRILRNLCLDHLSRARRRVEVPLDERLEVVDGAPSPEALAERAETRRRVWAALRRLAPPDREILILREFQDLTYAEIAAVLDVPKGTVMSRLHQSRTRLRAQLEADQGGYANV